ncbi:helix-turn-helix domain-containing protein [Natronoarchaeum rubrum]|uniref:helix-turn-helix domain-containing protein n=1 Tax=Natronoarchaeum rubrum TaxID=755311 RepID=UPI002111EE7B|nr:helix-turn-helix domain-containing protein [Natronoarchaeum rubrum]
MSEHTTTADDYDIDPNEIDYQIKCRWKDSTNNRSNYLAQIEGSDIWVAWRSWQTGPNESAHSIKGIGRLSLTGIDLDASSIAESIREGAERDQRDDRDEWGKTDRRLEDLRDAADAVAANLVEEWRRGCEEVVGDNVYEGVAAVDGTTAWASHVEEAHYHETKYALADANVDEDEHGRVRDVARSALSDVVRERRDQHRRPHLEYEARLEFDAEAWELRAIELEQQGVLKNKPELAKTKALLEAGHDYREIADRLDKSPSTVSRQVGQIEEWESRSEWTVENHA